MKWLAKWKILYLIPLLAMNSCQTVKPYQRQYVSDVEMQMTNDAGKNFNNYVNSIREGATPASANGKGSGGCGCN